MGVWLNYDFVPGDSVLFCDDFSRDNVGDLPAHAFGGTIDILHSSRPGAAPGPGVVAQEGADVREDRK
ncbi:MAG: hypothetical protein ACREND_11415 [Gemmatimonadaceae bacterium]